MKPRNVVHLMSAAAAGAAFLAFGAGCGTPADDPAVSSPPGGREIQAQHGWVTPPPPTPEPGARILGKGELEEWVPPTQPQPRNRLKSIREAMGEAADSRNPDLPGE